MVGQCANICPIGDLNGYVKKEINKFCLNSIEYSFIEENSSDGYILEIDIEYHDELHELHNDYPLATEKREISDCCRIVKASKYCK